MSRPNNRNTLARRLFIGGLAGAGLAPLARVTSAQSTGRTPSPAQTLGPFYPRNAAERPRATDADLLTVEGERVLSKGVPIFLVGRVVDRRGTPVADAAVEIWQCDANAVYHHPGGGAESERDPYFQGYGIDRTDARGDFRFRTIRPVAYPGRTPHIHVRVQPANGRAFATQLYLPDDPGNARDFLFSRLDGDEQRALLLAFEPAQSTSHPLARATRLTARIELVLV
jgi:protocatechuate 3,4-dioxygenase, beta subunit